MYKGMLCKAKTLSSLYDSYRLSFPTNFEYSLSKAKEVIENQIAQIESSDIFNITILRNYFFNSVLWYFEDKARDTKSMDSEIANVKRAIDYLNQKRNDAIEEINSYFYEEFASVMNNEGLLISETPGTLIDRLSILHLKKYSLENYLLDNPKDDDAKLKYERVTSQIEDLLLSLNNIITQIGLRNWYFKLYYNNKLYNDPKYNKKIDSNEQEITT